jgi:uncharacterized protein (DUF2132 family)
MTMVTVADGFAWLVYNPSHHPPKKAQFAMRVQPLHGITLESLLTQLVTHYGWDGLARKIDINCFTNDPSIKSSLKFLRKTPWARERVEALYLETQFTEHGAQHEH